ncbi:hypothetical protein [Pseudomonas sp. OV546]|uniref:hypothetical protein n=1 Tax=Pseudomonas sp. OV546 TaxID=1881063 RepID=UPI000B82A49B|nr:hypothetical protein [Pseudomonas sp. OV546]
MRFKDDLLYSVVLAALVLVYASTVGNTLHLGYWYLVGVPALMLLPGMTLRAQAMFLSGTTAAVSVTLLAYMSVVSSLGRDGGLMGLGHLFSVPGMFIGTSISAWLLRFRLNASLVWIIAGVAFVGAGLGFMIAQVIVCNTVLFCDELSYRFYR